MKTRWFLVIVSQGQWWVDCEGRAFGPFESCEVAVSDAVRYAEVFEDPDRQSQIWAPDETGRMSRVWSGAQPVVAADDVVEARRAGKRRDI